MKDVGRLHNTQTVQEKPNHKNHDNHDESDAEAYNADQDTQNADDYSNSLNEVKGIQTNKNPMRHMMIVFGFAISRTCMATIDVIMIMMMMSRMIMIFMIFMLTLWLSI